VVYRRPAHYIVGANPSLVVAFAPLEYREMLFSPDNKIAIIIIFARKNLLHLTGSGGLSLGIRDLHLFSPCDISSMSWSKY